MSVSVLDIGHGKDNFSKGVPGLQEWEFNNDVMKRAAKMLQEDGYFVEWTQPPDSNTVGLNTRSNKANKMKAPILISSHADASSNSDVSGHWGFYWHTSKNGKKIADIWRKHANKLLPNKDRGLIACKPNHWSNFHIVRKPKQACLLIEHAFMTNAEDLKLLQSNDFRERAAKVIYLTVMEYNNLEAKPKVNFEKLYNEYKTKYWSLVEKIESIKKIIG